MNSFDQMIRDQVVRVTALVMDINNISTEFKLDVDYAARFKRLTVRVNNNDQKVISKQVGKHRVFYIMFMETFFTLDGQQDPFYRDCTIDQMIHVLYQIKQALSEDHSKEKAA